MLNQHGKSREQSLAAGGGLAMKLSPAFRAGLVLGSLHLFFVLANVIDITRRQEGQWNMFWILCGYIDFPVTLLLSRIIVPIATPMFAHGEPYLAGGHGAMFIIFLLFHSIVGSVWYFALPFLISKASLKIASTKKAVAAAAALMIIPVPAHWLQLIRFFGRDTAPTAIVLNSVPPAVWTALFIWLLVINVRRKVLLWLLLLAPFVFCYLAQDLYYCIVLAPD